MCPQDVAASDTYIEISFRVAWFFRGVNGSDVWFWYYFLLLLHKKGRIKQSEISISVFTTEELPLPLLKHLTLQLINQMLSGVMLQLLMLTSTFFLVLSKYLFMVSGHIDQISMHVILIYFRGFYTWFADWKWWQKKSIVGDTQFSFCLQHVNISL